MVNAALPCMARSTQTRASGHAQFESDHRRFYTQKKDGKTAFNKNKAFSFNSLVRDRINAPLFIK